MTSSGTPVRIGLIGLGNAGGAMLQALARYSKLHVYDRNVARCRELAPACRIEPIVAENAAAVAREVDLIILSLPTPKASLSVAEEIRTSVGPNTVVVESSTVSPEDVEALHQLLTPNGVRVVDAALVGGVHKLADGEAVFLIGSTENDAGHVGTVLKRIAAETFFLGGRGNGMRTKLIVNSVAHVVYVVLMEAGALAAAQKLPLDVLYRLLERESGLMRPLTHRFGERLRAGDFSGGMSTANARKDSALVIEAARQFEVPLFATTAAHAVYELAMREGLGTLDYASIGKLWEKWLGITFAKISAE